MSWLHGYGQAPPTRRPPPVAVAPPVRQPADAPLRCPECQSDQLRVRSSSKIKVRLECTACAHQWDRGGAVRRVLLPLV
jgi:ssDNA-binding Zn-finger/Zn-ribbon topoisomerase 1